MPWAGFISKPLMAQRAKWTKPLATSVMTTAHYASWYITPPLHSRAIDLQGDSILVNEADALRPLN